MDSKEITLKISKFQKLIEKWRKSIKLLELPTHRHRINNKKCAVSGVSSDVFREHSKPTCCYYQLIDISN